MSQGAKTAGSRDATWPAQIRSVLLAAVGAVALAQEEVEEFVEKLVHKGEMAEKDGRKLLDDLVSQRSKLTVGFDLKAIEDGVKKSVESAMATMNLASRREISDLNARLAALSEKLERLEAGKRK